MKKFERAAELEKRAEAAKERDRKRKFAQQKREERESKEREARRKMGIGLATQLAGFSHSQKKMKGAMEGFLGLGKRKRTTEDKENKAGADLSAVKESWGQDQAESANTAAGELAFDDEMLLQDLETEGLDALPDAAPLQEHNSLPLEVLEENCNLDMGQPERKKRAKERIEGTGVCDTSDDPAITGLPKYASSPSVAGEPYSMQSNVISPSDAWADLLASNTQISRELSQATPTKCAVKPPSPMAVFSTQDLEITSDDLFDSGITVTKTTHPSISALDGVVARDFAYFKYTTFGDIVLGTPGVSKAVSRSHRTISRENMLANVLTPSPKMTSNCSSFTAVQCSFTSKYQDFGLSTQILRDAISDENESDTDEDESAVHEPSTTSMDRDKALMPPPPLRTSPKIFKPPSNQLRHGDGGLQILGLSTQILRDAVLEDDGSDTEEEDFLSPSPAKANDNGSKEVDHVRMPPPPPWTPPAPKTGLQDLGLSTQILHDIVSEDCSLSANEQVATGAGSSFGTDDLDDGFWNEAILGSFT
jgi:hypothetical protein